MSKSLRFPPNLSVMTLSPEMNDQSKSPWALFFLTYPRKKSTPHTVSPAHRREPPRMLVVRVTAASGFVVVVVLDLFFSFSFFFKETLFPREIQVYRFCADAERSGKEKKQVGFFYKVFVHQLSETLFVLCG